MLSDLNLNIFSKWSLMFCIASQELLVLKNGGDQASCITQTLALSIDNHEWMLTELISNWFQVVGEATAGDLCGEIGVLCYRPQLFTVRTKRLCQLLRLNRTTFLNIIQANVGDGTIIMNNLLQVYMLYLMI